MTNVGELEQGQAAILSLLARVGVRAEEGDDGLLLRHATDREADAGLKHRMAVVLDSAFQGFFHAAVEGHAFIPVDRFEAEFGVSLERAYPGAGAAFLRFARSYWTLRSLAGRVALRYTGIVMQQLLASIETRIREAFFPDESGDNMPAVQRARLQRRLIEQSGAPIDIDAFLLGNPLLMGNPLAAEEP